MKKNYMLFLCICISTIVCFYVNIFCIENITVIYTNSANGYLESCDCPDLPYGGLVRRVAVIKEIKKKVNNLIVVDSGDLLPAEEDLLTSEYCLRIIQYCSYDGVNIGDQEILNYKRVKPYFKKINFISANLQLTDENVDIKKFIIKKMGGLRIALVGVIDQETLTLFNKQKLNKIIVDNYIETVKKLLEELKTKYRVDLVVLLSHAGLIKDIKLAEEVEGIDVLVSGHSQDFINPPMKVKDTIIVQAGENGYYIGKLDLWINKNEKGGTKIVNYKNSFILLDKTIKDDLLAKKLVKEYKDQLKIQLEKLSIQ